VDGFVNFNSSNPDVHLDFLRQFARYSIICWYNPNGKVGDMKDAPKGWVLCDGKKWIRNPKTTVKRGDYNEYIEVKINSLNKLYIDNPDDVTKQIFITGTTINYNNVDMDIDIIETPNLKGRILIGNTTNLGRENFKFGTYGGSSYINITNDNINHYHTYKQNIDNQEQDYLKLAMYKEIFNNISHGFINVIKLHEPTEYDVEFTKSNNYYHVYGDPSKELPSDIISANTTNLFSDNNGIVTLSKNPKNVKMIKDFDKRIKKNTNKNIAPLTVPTTNTEDYVDFINTDKTSLETFIFDNTNRRKEAESIDSNKYRDLQRFHLNYNFDETFLTNHVQKPKDFLPPYYSMYYIMKL